MSSQSSAGGDAALDALRASPADAPAFLLHQGRPSDRWGWGGSLLRTPSDSPPISYRYTADGRSSLTGSSLDFTGNVWLDLRTLLNAPQLPGPWIGYISYDIARLIEPRKLRPPSPSAWPLIELVHCPHLMRFDPPRARDPIHNPQSTIRNPDIPRPDFERAIARALEYIAAGDIFQVNLAQRFTTTYTGDPRTLFEKLATISPAWYGAYLELGDRGRAICSTSPELFLHLEHGHAVTRPIKGTRPGAARLSGPHQPDPNLTELLHSPKDLAELNMIVDLMRNDLGRVCRYGSVRVSDPRSIESHPTVHHGVATIEGDLHESCDVVDLLRATLPGGSVTGAPKVRAMQIIDELEVNPRGPYCGCIGLICRDSLHLNIAIRTILLQRAGDAWSASFSVGGGIVADSTPASEYDETITKAAAMLAALTV